MAFISSYMKFPDFNSQDAQSQWQRFCEMLWFNDELGIWLDISRMHISFDQLQTLEGDFQEAFSQIDLLESGSIANHDEHRQVGHYWLRNPKISPNSETSFKIQNEINNINIFADQILSGSLKSPGGNKFTNVLWIGIGGSALGPLLMVKALQEHNIGMKFHFIDNLQNIQLKATEMGL